MAPDCSPSSAAEPYPRPLGRFVAVQALIWIVAAPILGVAVARLAVWIQAFRAPFLIFPFLVGCGLGLALAALMRLGQVGHRASIWSGAALAVATAVAGQHYFGFLDFKTAMAAKKPEVLSLEAFQAFQEKIPEVPTDFAQFMQRQAAEGRPVISDNRPRGSDARDYRLRGAAAWASWALDALVVLSAVSTIIYLACRSPYCSVCHSWYRTTRAGRLAADRVRRMADAASLPIHEAIDAGHYRLSQCASGCGLSRLQLACRCQGKTRIAEAWLSAAQREQVTRILDGVIV